MGVLYTDDPVTTLVRFLARCGFTIASMLLLAPLLVCMGWPMNSHISL
eukprot:COSAG02_NODE_15296_length_1183_cov_3.702808_3_plen_47_part_01